MERVLKSIDILRHELKALRFILDNYHQKTLKPSELPEREEFQAEQSRDIFDTIVGSTSRAEAERAIRKLDLVDVDIESFLRLTGEHYYSYPALVKQRARAIRDGSLMVERT